MKTLKNKTRILTYLICFSLLAVINVSCENNDEIEEIIEETEKEKKVVAKTMAKKGIKAGRTRIKRRRNGVYRTFIIVKNDTKDAVNSVAVEILQKEGVIKESKTYNLNYYSTIKEKKYYTFGDIKFENKEIENQELTVKVTLLDAKKQPIGKTKTEVVTVAGLAKANIKGGRTRLMLVPHATKTLKGKLTTEIEDPENEVVAVELLVDNLKGYTTTLNANLKNKKIQVTFTSKNNDDLKFKVTYIFKDLFGDEIIYFSKGSVERRVEILKAEYNTDRIRDMEG